MMIILTFAGKNALLNMTRILLFVALLSCSVFSSYAQTKYKPQLSIGGEFGLPVGEISNVYGTVLGASAKLELPVPSTPLNFVLTSGFSTFIVRLDYQGFADPVSYVIPVEVGGKYYFSKIGYAEADFGISSSVSSNYTGPQKAFIYSPVIGVSAPTNKHKATIDLGLRYEGRAENDRTVSQVALRLAYRFGL
jgi:hypothetical protein